MTFTMGNAGNVDVSSLESGGAFTLDARNSASAEINIESGLSANGVTINLGAASGDLSISAINSQGAITISGADSKMHMDIALLSASGAISLSLGAVSDNADKAFGLTSSSGDLVIASENSNVTINAVNYREELDIDRISGSGVTITFGDLSDDLSLSAIYAESILTLNGGDGSNFSGDISNIDINGASGWSIILPELGNGLAIDTLSFSGGGILKMTNGEADTVSAVSTSGAGDLITVDVDFREDSTVDTFDYVKGSGKDYVIIRNFDQSDSDVLDILHDGDALDDGSGSGEAVGLGVTGAAALLTTVLGSTVSSSDVATAGTSNNISAMFTYNGDQYFFQTDSDSTFENTEAIFRFVGVTDITDADIS